MKARVILLLAAMLIGVVFPAAPARAADGVAGKTGVQAFLKSYWCKVLVVV